VDEERGAAVVPASRHPHGYASARSLASTDGRATVAVADAGLPVAASRFCDESVRIPPSHDLGAYRDALLGLAARPDVRTIIPHRPQGPFVLSKYRERFAEYVDLVVPSLETLRNVHDRKRLVDAAADAGVPVPETRLLGAAADWRVDRVVKSRYNLLVDEYVDSFGPDESRLAKSVTHVPADDAPDAAAIREEMRHEPIVQEYVEGPEYVFGALYDRGEAVATFQHRQLRGDSYVGSGGVYRVSVDVPALEEAGRAILDRLDWHGLACIEYVEDSETGEFKLVEVNPRMWQSLPCATRAGADFPAWYWYLATDRGDRIDPGYRTGVATHYLHGELEHLVSVRRESSPFVPRPSVPARTWEVVKSCYEDPHFDYCHLDDPRPGLRELRTDLVGSVRRRLE
jgi:predicted ATP-grasp superfamily ATP-dependent carboligase